MVKNGTDIGRRTAAITSGAAPKKRTRGRGRPPTDADVEGELLAVACREFLEHGYGATSMARIVRAAGVSKTTLYSRFPTKADLFGAVLTLTYLKSRPSVILSTSFDVELATGLIDYGVNVLKISLTEWWSGLDRLIYAEGPKFPELSVAAHERIWLGIEVLSKFIAYCADRDGIPCRDPTSVAQVYMLALRGYHADVNFRREPIDPDETNAFVARTVEVLMKGRPEW